MTDLKTKIESLQQTVKADFTRPDPAKYEDMVAKLRASPGWDYLTKERGIKPETIEYFGLGYDKKRNAIAIPHFKQGELINIKYRLLEPTDARYTSEPNAGQWVFHEDGIEEALKPDDGGKVKNSIAIAEGEMDCISLWQAGFKNVISPGSGANSYGTWIETLDKIRNIWIAYDNDNPGQTAARELADRLGVEKCRNVLYPEDTPDANDFLQKNDVQELRKLFASSKPFYKYEFSGVGDVIHQMINDPMDYIEIDLFPGVKIERDQLMVVSGETNAGKSTFSLNVVKELAEKNIPSLFLPIERGVYSLGRRFIQIMAGKTQEDMQFTSRAELQELGNKLVSLPVYMAKPTINNLEKTIERAKRLFGVRVVIIDHMDYLIRGSGHKESLIADKMHSLKDCAERNKVIIIVISHINRGAVMDGRRPTLKNLKGSSALEQDSEVVAMLYPTEDRMGLEVDIQKNKGPMTSKTFKINVETGVMGGTYDPNDF